MDPFSLLVLGDTQYLFDGDRRRPDLLLETFRHVGRLLDGDAIPPVRHVIHVGDVTEHGWVDEAEAARQALASGAAMLGRVGMTIATGNHDVAHHSDDGRGATPFGDVFGPGCALLADGNAPVVEHGPGGYSSWRVVDVSEGARLGVLALDWRPSEAGWRWADRILTTHRNLPTVLVSHESALDGQLTAHGARVQEVLTRHPQVFLVLSGHEWPSTRVITPEREYHVVNYQQLPFGGAGTARVYAFTPDRGVCQVITLCPSAQLGGILGSAAVRRGLSFSRPEDQFAFPLPASLGGGRLPWQARGLSLVADTTPGRTPEFRLDLPDRYVIEVCAVLPPVMLREWQVLLTRLGPSPHDSPEPLAALSLSSENFIGWMAFTRDSETWATSHECAPGAAVSIVISAGDHRGMWIDGDPVGRVDAALGTPLASGPWVWRLGSGEYAGLPADDFRGEITRFRAWA